MALKIVWSKRAYLKFDQITSRLLAEWGEKSTREFIHKVFDFLEILSEYPEIGSLENKEKNIRGFTIVKQVTMFYRITKDHIVIVLFFVNRQNPVKKRF
ncbi:MAG: type II toxin-antitoxin system RelE/ParE family toxin [Bacteroidales bacterium]|nr:type II toxin-antitoxin system RelE/ParE family toxin [Bacteroidales bacterium]